MERKHINVRLELQLEEGRLMGFASNGGEEATRFSGWLGLIGAIDALVSDEDSTKPTLSPRMEAHSAHS